MPTAANLIVALTLGAFPSNATTVPWPNFKCFTFAPSFNPLRSEAEVLLAEQLMRQLMRQMMRQMMRQTSGRPS